MADSPIGISFIPSAQNQAQGGQNLAIDGSTGRGSTDLAQAFKVLSLRLPSALPASAPVDPSLLNSAGASGLPNLPSGLSPYAAVFQALLKSSLGVGMDQTPPSGSAPALPNPTDPPGTGPDLSALFGGGGTDTSAPARVDSQPSSNSILSGLFGGGTSMDSTASAGRPTPKVVFTGDGQPSPNGGGAQSYDTTGTDQPTRDFGNYY